MIQALGLRSQWAFNSRHSIGGRYFSRRYPVTRRMSLTLPQICILHGASRVSRPRRKLQFRLARVGFINIDREWSTRSGAQDKPKEFLFLKHLVKRHAGIGLRNQETSRSLQTPKRIAYLPGESAPIKKTIRKYLEGEEWKEQNDFPKSPLRRTTRTTLQREELQLMKSTSSLRDATRGSVSLVARHTFKRKRKKKKQTTWPRRY